MAKITYSKGSLKSQKDQIEIYQKFLPSLDLKKTQLLTESNRAHQLLSREQSKLNQYQSHLHNWVGLLGSTPLDLSGLVTLIGWEKRQENLAGVRLPVLGEIHFQLRPYTTLGSPAWVDSLVDSLKEMARLRLEVRILEERVQLLDQALKKVTQRINLFEKVLIPEGKETMRKIKLFLSDAERTAVFRSKLAKAKLAVLAEQGHGERDPFSSFDVDLSSTEEEE